MDGPEQDNPTGPSITVGQLLQAVTPIAWVTPTITAVLIVCFVASVVFGVSLFAPTAKQLLDVGAAFGPSLVDGEWWRLATATLLHAGVLHLAVNLWALWNAGIFTERIFGNLAFIAIYTLSGIGASLLSMAVHPMTVSVGASGAIFGVYGALLAFTLTHRGLFPRELLERQRNSLLAFLGYNLFFALVQKNVDLSGHAGGLAIGMLAGVTLSRDFLHPSAAAGRRVAGATGIAGLLLAGGWGVAQRIEALPLMKATRLARLGETLVEQGQFEPAVAAFTKALELDRSQDLLLRRGWAYYRLHRRNDALADFREAHAKAASAETSNALCLAFTVDEGVPGEPIAEEIDYCTLAIDAHPTPHAYLSRAMLQLRRGKSAEGLSDATKALELDPANPHGLGLRAKVRLDTGDLEGADADCTKLFAGDRELPTWAFACVMASYQRHDRPTLLARLTRLEAAFGGDAHVLLAEAEMLGEVGEHAKASAALDRAVELQPDYPPALNNRAWDRVSRQDYAGARVDADKAVTLDPDNANMLGTRCFAYAGLGDLATARKDCTRAVELNTDDLTDRGMLAYLDGRRDEAVTLWEQAGAKSQAIKRVLEPWLEKARKRK